MNHHSFRWPGLAFGLLFLSIAGNWAVWEQDLLTRQQFSYTLSGALIVLGVIGVIATFWRPRTQPAHHDTTTTTTTLEENHEEPDPQP